MKYLLILLSLILSNGTILKAGLEDDYAQVKKELRELRKNLNSIRYSDKVSGSAEMDALDAELLKANKELNKVRSEHPKMKELVANDEAYKKAMIDAKVKKNDAEFEKAKSAFTSNRIKFEAMARTIESLQPLYQKMNDLSAKRQKLEDKLMREHGGEEYMNYLKLEEKRKKLREQMRAKK